MSLSSSEDEDEDDEELRAGCDFLLEFFFVFFFFLESRVSSPPSLSWLELDDELALDFTSGLGTAFCPAFEDDFDDDDDLEEEDLKEVLEVTEGAKEADEVELLLLPPLFEIDLGFLLPFCSFVTFFRGVPKREENWSVSDPGLLFFEGFEEEEESLVAEEKAGPPGAAAAFVADF